MRFWWIWAFAAFMAAIPAVGHAQAPVASSNIATNQVSVGTTVGGTLIVAPRPGNPYTGRTKLVLTNVGTQTVFIGAQGLTVSTGIPLLQNGTLTLDTTAAIYGIVAGTTATVGFAELY